jgi:YD repeat-containing protein
MRTPRQYFSERYPWLDLADSLAAAVVVVLVIVAIWPHSRLVIDLVQVTAIPGSLDKLRWLAVDVLKLAVSRSPAPARSELFLPHLSVVPPQWVHLGWIMYPVSRLRHFALVVSASALTLLLVAISLVLADVTYTYNPDGRLTEVCNSLGQAAKYGYDSDGNITAITRTPCPTPTATATP